MNSSTVSTTFSKTMQKSMLSSEVIGIVQHVELNRSGWWERAVQRLVLAAIWLAIEPLGEEEILKKLQTDFSLAIRVIASCMRR